MRNTPIIFTHYGYSDYLEFTLMCARETNPDARTILIGDEFNEELALKKGWEHVHYNSLRDSYHDRFLSVFRHIQGPRSNHMRNGSDWLRYVFERWFFIRNYIAGEGISRFWHFDSDTMILQDLRCHEEKLSDYEYTMQCNGICLNGIATATVVNEYCVHICDLFEDEDYLRAQQEEFDTVHPEYAFTEMRAFDSYKKIANRKGIHLAFYDDNAVFDDCIAQAHGFDMTSLPSGERVKLIYGNNGKIYGTRDGVRIEFLSLNLSWVPLYLFEWVWDALHVEDANIKDISCGLLELVNGHKRIIKKFVKRILTNAGII